MPNRYLSKTLSTLKPSGIRKFFDIAATMEDVISLGIGEPDFTTPQPIIDAGVRSLHEGIPRLHLVHQVVKSSSRSAYQKHFT